MKLDLSKLNDPQRLAVHHGDGPLLILAGAGSGKTTTMAHRIAHLVAERALPASRVLGLSFTNKAARELKDRVSKLVIQACGTGSTNGLTISTFHSLCVRILRRYGDRLGFTRDFSIIDQSDQTDLIRRLLKNIKIDDRKFDTGWVAFQIGQTKNKFLTGDEATAHLLELSGPGKDDGPTEYAIIAASVFPKYQEQLKLQNSMDFDDLIYNAVTLLEKDADIREGLSVRFQQILVDEYQDTNPAQFRLLELLTSMHKNICVVGDDDQSIYGWRGPTPPIFCNSTNTKGAQIITLDQNYRSTTLILDAANAVIGKIKIRHPKKLWSDREGGDQIEMIIAPGDREEADLVADEIRFLAFDFIDGAKVQTRKWKDFAILYRSNTQSRLFEEALRMRQIPYKIVGSMSFLDRKEIKDALSYWRVIVNPKDDPSARRIVNWPTRGIGRTGIEQANEIAHKRDIPFLEALRAACNEGALPTKSKEPVNTFLALIDSLRASLASCALTPEGLSNWARESLARVDFKRGLQDDYEDPKASASRWDNAEELVNSLGQMPLMEILAQERVSHTDQVTAVQVLREFLPRLALQAQNEKDDQDEKNRREPGERDELTLLTLHGAKGLEFRVVFLVGLEDGLLPHQRSIDEAGDLSEERRLCYVGITRAMDRLFLTRASHRIRWGKNVARIPSRFIPEIPPALITVRGADGAPKSSAMNTEEGRAEHEKRVGNILASIKNQLKASLAAPPPGRGRPS